jgi:MFS transporter, OFA family, oxalate/formate antiporter
MLFCGLGWGKASSFCCCSRLLRAPRAGETPKPSTRLTHSLRDYSPLEMLKSPVFWVLYLMFVLVAASGLMATAQIAPIAKDFGLADQKVDMLFVAATTLSAALVIDNILNGLARPCFGWLSDIIGRETTTGIVFTLGAVAYWGLGALGHTPYTFILLAGLIFFHLGRNLQSLPRDRDRHLRREIRHGQCRSSLYRTAFWLVPLANVIRDYTGGCHWVFVIAAIMNLTVAALALFVLRPMRWRITKHG